MGDQQDPSDVIIDDQVEADGGDVPALAEDAAMEGGSSHRGSVASSSRGLRRSRSGSSVASGTRSSMSSFSRRRAYGKKASPFSVPPPFDLPVVDQFGFPCSQLSLLDEGDWDERHQLGGSENELKPKGMRDYFSRPETKKELKRELKYNPKISNSAKLLQSMSLPEINDRKPSPICPDAGPPLVPGRHVFGGNMMDRDGEERMWNDRWHKGISILNDNCHPDHRSYFTQKSLFEESPSQNWRRYMDQEVAHGVWKTIQCKKQSKFQPLGGRLRGRSGTPIPGASP